MAGKGRKFSFHGAFKKKADARRKESAIGGFIRRMTICRKNICSKRYVVMKKRGR